MELLIVYYSRTGTNKTLAATLQEKLNCEKEEIIDTTNRTGILGFLRSGRDAMFKRMTKIKPIQRDPGSYNLVIIVSPVWAGTLPPATRTFIFQNKEKFKKIAFFSVSGTGTDNKKAISEIGSLANQEVIVSLLLSGKEVKQEIYKEKVENFIERIKMIK